MHLFDLHCDSLYIVATNDYKIKPWISQIKEADKETSLFKNNFHLSFDRGSKYSPWIQTMAVWIPDELRGSAAFDFTVSCAKRLKSEIANSEIPIHQIKNFSEFKKTLNSHNVILAVEGGAALHGELQNIKKLSKIGVRFITLTWNGENEIGDGAGVENPKGLTDFGKKAIAELEKNKIVIDVSHASDPLFYDVATIATKPFIATHSNSRAVCSHKRNLTDEQFTIIKKSNGLVGLNFARIFLNSDSDATLAHLLNHAEHFLSLGGEDIICLGSDFDGTDMPDGVSGIESMTAIYEYFLKHNYKEELVRKIFFKNAYKFCENFDN
ncbi:peptidase [Clostridia bacterium]|nr:peptidase [Clostridia bacterium]